ncbi:MAG: hypothetical protein ACYCZZ_01020 [Minisyncoccota bacterium]
MEPPKNETLLKVATYLAFLFAVAGSLSYFLLKHSGTPKSETATQTTFTPAEELALQEQVAPLIKAGDMTACKQVQNDMYRAVCVNNIALNKATESKDISYCQYLDNKLVSIESCERNVLFQKVAETENQVVCSETKNAALQKECEASFFSVLANKHQDPKLCDKNTDATNANQCWNAYYAQSMFASVSGSGNSPIGSCSVFRGKDAQSDCAGLRAAITAKSIQKLQQACQSQKTPLFLPFCSSLGGAR